jgi:glycopeptide antibiotics resistance protein
VSRRHRSALEGPGPRRPSLPPPRLALAAAWLYAAVLAVVTLAPIRWRPELARYPGNRRPQLVPVWNLVGNLRHGDRVLATLAGAAGNVALFLPLGFLLPLLVPRMDRLWRTTATGFVTSAAIELSQVAFPGVRRADVNDVLANTLGAALGFLAWRLASRVAPSRALVPDPRREEGRCWSTSRQTRRRR